MSRPERRWESSRGQPSYLISMATFVSGGARGLIDAQRELDAFYDEGETVWDDTGVPPAKWDFSSCRLQFQVACVPVRKAAAEGRTSMAVAPRLNAGGMVTIAIRQQRTPTAVCV